MLLQGVAHAEAALPPGLGYASAFVGYTPYVADAGSVDWRAANDRAGPPAAAPTEEAAPKDEAAREDHAAPGTDVASPQASPRPSRPSHDHSHHKGRHE